MLKRVFLIIFLIALSITPSLAQDNSEVDIPGEWTYLANMGKARAEFSSVLVDGKIYVAGGLKRQWEGTEEFEVYDIESDTWTELAPLPNGPMHHVQLAEIDGKIYLSGGWYGRQDVSDDMHIYDIESGEWLDSIKMPAVRTTHGMVVLEGKLYFIGGIIGVNEPETDIVWRYDPETDEWETDLAPMPTARESLAVVVLDGKIYAIAGRLAFTLNLPGTDVYDPETNSWTTLDGPQTIRSGHAAAVVDGRIHILGGEDGDPPGTIASHEVYNPETETWLTSVNTPRWALHGMATEGYEGKLYILGGSIQGGEYTADGAIKQVIVFTPDNPQ